MRPGSTPYRTPGRRRDRRRCGRRCATLGAERIGHGTTAAQDPDLLAHLAAEQVPLEVCPSSNIATRAVATLAEHPITTFRDAGVVVTVNSDDPPMFNTTLNREYAIAADLLGLDEAGVADLARTAVRVSFLDDAGKTAADRRDRRLPGCRNALGKGTGPAVSYSAGPILLYDTATPRPGCDTRSRVLESATPRMRPKGVVPSR